MYPLKYIIPIVFIFICFNKTFSQNIIKAKVFDFVKNKPITDVSIQIKGTNKGTYSKNDGTFSLLKIKNRDILVLSKIGYKTTFVDINTIGNIIYLEQQINELSLVTLRSFSSSQLKNTVPDQIYYSKRDIQRQPFILGEKDVIKLLQYTPGVQQATEGQSGLIVRGGNGSMNLTLLDNIYIHNTAHLGGLFSAINSDFVESLEFSKAGFDASYGGRLSSVTNIKTLKIPDSTSFSGSLGLLSAKLTGNIKVNEKHNLLLSGRRTYFEIFKPFIKDKDAILGKDSNYYLYDILVKHTYKLSNKNQVETMLYITKDDFYDKTKGRDRQLQWGNFLIGTTYSHKFNKTLSSETTLSNSFYEFSIGTDDVVYDYQARNTVNVLGIKHHFVWALPNYVLKIGAQYNTNTILPKRVLASINNSPIEILNQDTFKYSDFSLFADIEQTISKSVKLKTGLRFTRFKNQSNALVGKNIFSSLEPRLSVKYQFNDQQAFKFSYQRLRQFIHQASISSFSLPADFFVISTKTVKPQTVNQVSLGYVYEVNGLQFNSATFFKNVSNYSEFENGSINNLFSNNIYDDILVGHFNAYGLELSASKKINKLTAQGAITLSKTIAKFKDINQGQYFPTNFDRPININTIVNYKLNNRLEFGGLFLYTSGQNYTRPRDIRIINERPIINFEAKNTSRFPSYHRLDLSCTYAFKPKGNWSSKLNLTLYNIYNNKNPFQITFSTDGSSDDAFVEIIEDRDNLFPFLPTLNWLFSF
ncbi:Outer membrane receptor for ferrienterochelin and colicins [Algibacter pectinivorans]|uniref:Outer membrane receptor for ferrienterochelin and colicins n=1 Tax=Algibacter pectinivorans TaxID=870482 RepID=A0A1I1MP32_9FLAO|nr:Outer membrane receptor for ferrienterochelin and colicins [Algibacter pectinivorans]